MENKIRVYDIDYLYLTDEDYAVGFNEDNDFDEDGINNHIEHLNQNKELIFKFEDWYLTQDEWNDKEHMEGEMVNLIEQETGEYFEGFEWEYLVESN